jgi:hypothetical protein
MWREQQIMRTLKDLSMEELKPLIAEVVDACPRSRVPAPVVGTNPRGVNDSAMMWT